MPLGEICLLYETLVQWREGRTRSITTLPKIMPKFTLDFKSSVCIFIQFCAGITSRRTNNNDRILIVNT